MLRAPWLGRIVTQKTGRCSVSRPPSDVLTRIAGGSVPLPSMHTAASFWVEDRVGLAPPVFNLMSFGRYPITIYDLKVKVLLSTVVPFAFASFYPTTLALGRSEFLPFFWAVPAVALLLALLNVALWRKGIAKYGSTGS